MYLHTCVHLESQIDILACTPTRIQQSVQIPLTLHSPAASYALGGIALSPGPTESIQHRTLHLQCSSPLQYELQVFHGGEVGWLKQPRVLRASLLPPAAL